MNPSSFEYSERLVNDNIQQLGQYYKYLGLLHDIWVFSPTSNLHSELQEITYMKSCNFFLFLQL